MFGSRTTLITYDEEMSDIILYMILSTLVKSLEDSCLLIKGASKTTKNKAKYQKGGFIEMLLGKLSANLFGNMLARKSVLRAGEATIRTGQDF